MWSLALHSSHDLGDAEPRDLGVAEPRDVGVAEPRGLVQARPRWPKPWHTAHWCSAVVWLLALQSSHFGGDDWRDAQLLLRWPRPLQQEHLCSALVWPLSLQSSQRLGDASGGRGI